MRLRVLIVDDEPLARRRISRFLRSEPDVDVVGEVADGRSAVTALRDGQADLVFLDVQMPELDGFGVIREVGLARLPGVVFVTAFDQYALQAFEVHAVDYLLKPFTRERLQAALARARTRRRAEASQTDPRLTALLNELVERPRFLQRLPVRSGPRIVLLETGQIDWIQAADNYVLLHAGGREFLMRETMSRLEQELDPEAFVRIHRSAMVRIDRVAELQPSVHGDFRVTLKNGTYLTLSRYYRERVERMLRKPL
jgi:two-component system, LytTR family, response regulator